MRTHSIKEISRSTTCNFQRKLDNEFGQDLCYTTTKSNRVLVFPSNASLEKLVEENYQLKKEVDKMKSENKESILIDKSANILRSHIVSHEKSLSWPPESYELENSSGFVPSSLRQFVCTLLDGKCVDDDVQNTIIDAISQDIVYAVHNGKKLMPKTYFRRLP